MSYANDTFTRANQSNWGTASDGEAWAKLAGSSPTLAIASNEGTWTGVTGSSTWALGTNTLTDAEVSVRLKITNAGDSVGIFARSDSGASNFYRAFAQNTTLTLSKTVSGSTTTLATGAITFNTATFYWLKLHVQGSNLYARWWADGNSEPTTWNLTTTDSAVTGAGRYGVRISLNGTGDTVSIDTFAVNRVVVTSSTVVRTLVRTQVTKSTGVRALVRTQKTLSTALRTLVQTQKTVSTALRTLVRTPRTLSTGIRAVVKGITKTAPLRVVVKGITRVTSMRVLVRTQHTLSTSIRAVLRSTHTQSTQLRTLVRTSVSKSIVLRALVRTTHSLSVHLRAVIRTQITESAPVRALVRTAHSLSTGIRTRVRTQISKSTAMRTLVRSQHSLTTTMRVVLRGQTRCAQIRIVVYTPFGGYNAVLRARNGNVVLLTRNGNVVLKVREL